MGRVSGRPRPTPVGWLPTSDLPASTTGSPRTPASLVSSAASARASRGTSAWATSMTPLRCQWRLPPDMLSGIKKLFTGAVTPVTGCRAGMVTPFFELLGGLCPRREGIDPSNLAFMPTCRASSTSTARASNWAARSRSRMPISAGPDVTDPGVGGCAPAQSGGTAAGGSGSAGPHPGRGDESPPTRLIPMSVASLSSKPLYQAGFRGTDQLTRWPRSPAASRTGTTDAGLTPPRATPTTLAVASSASTSSRSRQGHAAAVDQ